MSIQTASNSRKQKRLKIKNLLSVEFRSGHLVPCFRCIVHVLEVDKCKPSAAARVSVKHYLNLLQMSKPTKEKF